MAERFDDYMFVIFSSHSLTKIPASAKEDFGRPKILIFISEEKGEYPYHLKDDFHAIFKSYLNDRLSPGSSVFHFPLGYSKAVEELPMIPILQRKYEAFFSGNLNNNRIPLFKQLSVFKYLLPETVIKWLIKIPSIKNRITNETFIRPVANSIIKFNTGFQKGLSPQEYAKAISNSKIVLCPKGFNSPESFRHSEAMRAGCIIISEQLPPNEFYSNSPIFQVPNWKTGIQTALSLLADEKKLTTAHEQTITWWREKCSEKAIALYVDKSIRSIR
ncbi:MAG: hypothetical protein QM764_00530 [Chitinophagaceae bacterium]